MSNFSLIIITGLPGSGKTTLGRKLAKEFHLPFICKDDIKELLFNNLGWKDREWSQKIGGSSFDILYFITESIIKARKSLIVETNFDPQYANKKFINFKEKYNFTPFQIRCFANGEILFDRFKKRANENRHPGHVDSENLDEWRPILLKEKIEVLNIGGEIFDLDTSDFNKIDYNNLLSALNQQLSPYN